MAWRVSKDTFALEAMKVLLLSNDELSLEDVADYSCKIAGMMVDRLNGDQAKAGDSAAGPYFDGDGSPGVVVIDDFDEPPLVHGEPEGGAGAGND
jgi:hypothetical protein